MLATLLLPERNLRWHPSRDAGMVSTQIAVDAALVGFHELTGAVYGYATTGKTTNHTLAGHGVDHRAACALEGTWVLRNLIPELHPVNYLPQTMIALYPGLVPTEDRSLDRRIRLAELKDGGRMFAFTPAFPAGPGQYDCWAYERKIDLELTKWIRKRTNPSTSP